MNSFDKVIKNKNYSKNSNSMKDFCDIFDKSSTPQKNNFNKNKMEEQKYFSNNDIDKKENEKNINKITLKVHSQKIFN